VGDPVPAANVAKHGYEVGVQVAEYGTPEAEQVTSPQPADAVDGEGAEQARAAQEQAAAGQVPASPAAAEQEAGDGEKTTSKRTPRQGKTG
jgi:hypothetical protein